LNAASAAPLLEVRRLSVERGGRQLFTEFSLTVARGELIHVRGANGAGKTTLLRILAGLSRHGFDGAVTAHVPRLFLGHQHAVKGLLSPRENLAWHPGGESAGSIERIDAALAAVGLYGYEDLPAAQLSAGQQRRVNLARLYLSERRLWLLDEPFTAIDVDGVAQLAARFAAHAAGGGAVVLSSHQALPAEHAVRIVDIGSGPDA
jgi:heme exporter protein A